MLVRAILTTILAPLLVAGCAGTGRGGGTANVPGKLSGLCSFDENPLPEVATSPWIGIYDGYWSGKLEQTVIIYDVDERGHVETYYIHGAYKPWGINRANCARVSGTIEGDEIVLNEQTMGAKVSYQLDGNTLSGLYETSGRANLGIFERVTPPLSKTAAE